MLCLELVAVHCYNKRSSFNLAFAVLEGRPCKCAAGYSVWMGRKTPETRYFICMSKLFKIISPF